MIQADTDLYDPLQKPLDGSARKGHPLMLQMLVGLEEQAGIKTEGGLGDRSRKGLHRGQCRLTSASLSQNR
jgi:hypothetical protein